MDDATAIAIIVAPLKGRAFKIEISKVSGSALAAEICAAPHNRLLRRQHCSSLCEQSELQCCAPFSAARNSSIRCPVRHELRSPV